MNIQVSKQIQAALGAAILAASLLTVARADADAPPMKVVSYADLDISTPAGAQVLYQRIQRAAREVCPADNFHDLAVWHARQCISKSVDEAVKAVHSPALSALHAHNTIRLARN
jgi:UrcA family protein